MGTNQCTHIAQSNPTHTNGSLKVRVSGKLSGVMSTKGLRSASALIPESEHQAALGILFFLKVHTQKHTHTHTHLICSPNGDDIRCQYLVNICVYLLSFGGRHATCTVKQVRFTRKMRGLRWPRLTFWPLLCLKEGAFLGSQTGHTPTCPMNGEAHRILDRAHPCCAVPLEIRKSKNPGKMLLEHLHVALSHS